MREAAAVAADHQRQAAADPTVPAPWPPAPPCTDTAEQIPAPRTATPDYAADSAHDGVREVSPGYRGANTTDDHHTSRDPGAGGREETMAINDPDPDPAWMALCERAAAQLARHGHLRRAGTGTRRWADQQIRALRSGILPATRRQHLASIGITAESLTTTEATLLAELDWWIDRHGTADVPQQAHSRTIAGTSYWLGKRVSEARVAHARGTLPAALAEQLEQRTGWSWRVMETRWDRLWEAKYATLTQHVNQHGSLNGLERATYAWLMRQRAALDTMPPDRRQRLQDVPGALISRDTRVPDFVAAARAWLAAAPGRGNAGRRTMAQLRYSDTITLHDTEVPLGKRATYYRRRHAGLEGTHPLTSAEITQIEALPGWAWQIEDQRRRPGTSTSGTS